MKENECQEEERVAESVEIFHSLKLICNRLAHPGESENVVACYCRLLPLCLQIVHVVMNNLYSARRLDDSAEELVIELSEVPESSGGQSPASSTASDRAEEEAFYRSVHKHNRDIMNNFLEAIPTKEAILGLSVDELARLLESRVTAPAIIHDGGRDSLELSLAVVSKGVCEYESSPKGWSCCARNECEDPWKDNKWSYEIFAGGG